MKRFIAIIALGLLAGLTASAHGSRPGISFSVFYSSLGTYGEWIEIQPAVFAWRPVQVDNGWRPYTVGRWAWTDDGWYWVSDEPWGWAAYHYGRWYYDDYYGWMWIPGYEWAPAWVEWRYGGSQIGWAPLTPYAVFSVHIGIYYKTHWTTPHHYWSFVDCRYVTHHTMHRYVYRSEHNQRYIGRTRSSGSVRHEGGRTRSAGPGRSYVEERGRIRVEKAEMVDVSDRSEMGPTRSNGRERISVYRPPVEAPREGNSGRPSGVRRAEKNVDIDARYIDNSKPDRGGDRTERSANDNARESSTRRPVEVEQDRNARQERPERSSIERRESQEPRKGSIDQPRPEGRKEERVAKPAPQRKETVRQQPRERQNDAPQVQRKTERREQSRSAPQRQESKPRGDTKRPPQRDR